MHRVRGAVRAAVHNKRVRRASVRAIDAPLRLPRDPAHPGALHGGADGAGAGRAARAHGAAHPGPVRELRRAARAGARRAGRQVRTHVLDRYSFTLLASLCLSFGLLLLDAFLMSIVC